MSELTATKIIPNLYKFIPEKPSNSIASRPVFSDEDCKLILFAFDRGEGLAEHSSPAPAILHFLEGEAQVTLGDEQISAEAGTWVHMPAKLPHSIKATTPVQMLLMQLV